MNILGFSTSNKIKSINNELVKHVVKKYFPTHDHKILDMTMIDLPIYSEDLEAKIGIPKAAEDFFNRINESDLVIISLAEHNGHYTAFYKNLFDWASRINMRVYQDKKIIVLSTSPGEGGASSVMSAFKNSAQWFGADIIADVSIPNYYEHEKDGVFEFEGLEVLNNIQPKL